ncbi:hypothetical protein GOBAR_AA03884 [Gossypium barbadense]|uniref:Uncharacterized protein n=1 Tax=Gossypium barbadense TaxID=3634 RepID=A0A2P5YM62_GOSBA|nr:hypothetical protein GOBAR_AA03884 [Gossypium barbadense]
MRIRTRLRRAAPAHTRQVDPPLAVESTGSASRTENVPRESRHWERPRPGSQTPTFRHDFKLGAGIAEYVLKQSFPLPLKTLGPILLLRPLNPETVLQSCYEAVKEATTRLPIVVQWFQRTMADEGEGFTIEVHRTVVRSPLTYERRM